jgi:hypothetical protein
MAEKTNTITQSLTRLHELGSLRWGKNRIKNSGRYAMESASLVLDAFAEFATL